MARTTPSPGSLRTVLWQGIWRPGAEWCELEREGEGWGIAGMALVAIEGAPWQVAYRIALDATWATLAAQITVLAGGGRKEPRLLLTASADRTWRVERTPAAGIEARPESLAFAHGVFDVDLGFSPSTNTLPIRRLAPAMGTSVEVTAVWVRFPELTIEPLPQRYTRLAERHYRYESGGGAFMTELEVDDLGLVVNYEGGWQRIAESSQPLL